VSVGRFELVNMGTHLRQLELTSSTSFTDAAVSESAVLLLSARALRNAASWSTYSGNITRLTMSCSPIWLCLTGTRSSKWSAGMRTVTWVTASVVATAYLRTHDKPREVRCEICATAQSLATGRWQ